MESRKAGQCQDLRSLWNSIVVHKGKVSQGGREGRHHGGFKTGWMGVSLKVRKLSRACSELGLIEFHS